MLSEGRAFGCALKRKGIKGAREVSRPQGQGWVVGFGVRRGVPWACNFGRRAVIRQSWYYLSFMLASFMREIRGQEFLKRGTVRELC